MAADRESDFELSPLLDKLAEEYANEPKSRKFLPLAEEYRKSKMYEEAIFFLQEGLKNHPHFLPAKLTLVRCLIESKEYDQAKNICLEVISDNPENLSFLRSIAETYYGLNDKERALGYYKKILALNPADMLSERKSKEIEKELTAMGRGRAASMSAIAEEPAIEEEILEKTEPPVIIPSETKISEEADVQDQVAEVEQPTEIIPDTEDKIQNDVVIEPILEEEDELALLEPVLDMEESLAGFTSDEIIEPTSEHEIPIPMKPEVKQPEEVQELEKADEVILEPEGFVSPGGGDLSLNLDDEDSIFDTDESPDFGLPSDVEDKTVQLEGMEDEATSTARRRPLIELDLDLDDEVISESADLELTLSKHAPPVEELEEEESPTEEFFETTEEVAEPEVEKMAAEGIPFLEETQQRESDVSTETTIADEDIEIMAPGGMPLEYEELPQEDTSSPAEQVLDLTPDFLITDDESKEADEELEVLTLPEEAADISDRDTAIDLTGMEVKQESKSNAEKPDDFSDLETAVDFKDFEQEQDLGSFIEEPAETTDLETTVDLSGLVEEQDLGGIIEEPDDFSDLEMTVGLSGVEKEQELGSNVEEPVEIKGLETEEDLPVSEAKQKTEEAVEQIEDGTRLILEENVFDDIDLGPIDDYEEETKEAEEVDNFEDLTLSEQIEEIENSLNESSFVPPVVVESHADEEEEIVQPDEIKEIPLKEELISEEELAEATSTLELIEDKDERDFSFIDEDQDAVKLPSLDTEDELIPAGTTSDIPPIVIPESQTAEEDEPIPVTLTSAKIYEEQGHYEEALRIYKKLLDREPYFKNIAERIVNLEKRMALARIPSTRKFSEVEVTKLEKWLNNIKTFKKHLKNWPTD